MKKILATLLLAPALAWAEEGGPALDRAPIDLHDKASLQHGAQIFVNNCLNCHTASLVRYGRLTDLGLTEQQIKDNLLFSEKIGDSMAPPQDPKISKAAFGVVPPDLSLIARSRSPDWLYTYLRSFYRDDKSKTGWNNTVFPNVSMPNVLWRQQGEQSLEVKQRQNEFTGDVVLTHRLVLAQPGSLSSVDYDRYVGDLVNYLAWMAEPAQGSRHMWGVLVLFFFTGFFVLALLLKKEYWKDVH
jgi:ubiquinol-cytochrome c reductase cytochrome c1 subunit